MPTTRTRSRINSTADAQVALDKLQEKALRRVSEKYQADVVAPLLRAIDTSEDRDDLKARLPAVFGRMKTGGIRDAIAGLLTQVSLIGRTIAMPTGRTVTTTAPSPGGSENPLPLSIALVTTDDFVPQPESKLKAIFDSKVPMTSAAFDGLKDESRARAFRIAGVNKGQLIDRAMAEIAKTVEDGSDYKTLARRLKAIFAEEGLAEWPMGKLWITVRQNVLTTMAIAKERIANDPVIRGEFPFKQYLTVGNGTPGFAGVRATHAALHKVVFRADDPFWRLFTPPWEWG